MAPGEVSGLKNGESMMAGVLGGDYKDGMADRLLRSLSRFVIGEMMTNRYATAKIRQQNYTDCISHCLDNNCHMRLPARGCTC